MAPQPARIGLVAEGPTDRIVVEAALRSVLGHRQFVLHQLQPEESEAFGRFGGGWSGVHKWCRQSTNTGAGRMSADETLFLAHDLLVLHLDADVAQSNYKSGNVARQESDAPLPCARPCPPASDTVRALRNVLLSWMGETTVPPRVVLCIPAQAMDAWVVAALFPSDPAAREGSTFECLPAPEKRLGQQPKPSRIRKSTADYRRKQQAIAEAWPGVADKLTEARRFHDDLRLALA